MSSAEKPTNIVDLGSRQGPRGERIGKLVESVRQFSTRHLKALADNMFERVDDTLFDLAERAESNAVQTQYFDGMREVRKKRARLERQFQEEVRRALSDLAAGRTAASHGGNGTGPGELSLVDDSELEESLAVTSMVSKAESRFAQALYGVNQRLSMICGGNKIDDACNPVGPALLCHAFRQAMRDLAVETRVRLIIYKLFDRYVMAGLGDLYASINRELAQAGVLPKLKHGHVSAGHSHKPSQSATSAASLDGAPATGDADFQAEFYQTLNTLLSSRPHGAAVGSGLSANMPSLSPAELLGALTLLQNEAAGGAVPDDASPPEGATSAQDSAALKKQLLGQIGRLRGDSHAHMSGADEDTIDLVGMLFEFILEDRNLPTEMQVLLSRLQIPYLKAAILDRRMFAHTSHPARRLLDALAEAAKSWSRESDRDQRLYGKVQSIVKALLQDFDDDMDIFARLEQDLSAFMAAGRKRSKLSEQRVAEAVRGREKLEQARRRVAQEILARVDGRELPKLVHGILTRAWANYLVLTLLRQGEESQEFRVGLRFVDDFVWSATPKHTEAEHDRLRQLLPLLEKSLRHGLATVAFQDADVESLMTQLNSLYRVQLGEAEPETLETAENDQTAAAAIPESVETIASAEVLAQTEPAEPEPAPDVHDPNVEKVRALKVGCWVEFSSEADPTATTERAKLSWISPISGKYLFVNRRGLKVADKTVHELAEQFASEHAIVLEELPLFDRALDAIVDRLRKTQSERSRRDGETDASADPQGAGKPSPDQDSPAKS